MVCLLWGRNWIVMLLLKLNLSIKEVIYWSCKWYWTTWGSRVSSVGIATCYRLDGPGIESRWGGESFRARPDWPCGPPGLLYDVYRVFPGGRAARVWCWPLPPLAPRFRMSLSYIWAVPVLLSVAAQVHMGWPLLDHIILWNPKIHYWSVNAFQPLDFRFYRLD
jgi:hypothetical protein